MKTTMSVFRHAILGLSVISASLFISCNKNNDDNTPVDGAGLMAVNLAPDVTASFALSGNSISPALPFNSYTGGYLSIFPGSRTVEAYTFGGLAAQNTVNFETGKYYSLFLVDTGAALQQVIVQDNFDTLVSTSQSFVRYINAIQGSPAPSVTIAANGSNVVNENAAFADVSDFSAIDAGAVTITVSNGSTINASRTITLESQKVYTILISGIAGETGDKAVQIKYITNGTVDGTAGRVSGSSILTSN